MLMNELKARLESLGILNKVSNLREASTPTKKQQRTPVKRVYGLTPVRRSQRIKDVSTGTVTVAATLDGLLPRRSNRLKSSFSYAVTPKQGFNLTLIFLSLFVTL